MAVITTTLWPQFRNGFSGVTVKHTQGLLVESLRYAQARAITTRRPVQWVLTEQPRLSVSLREQSADARDWQPIIGTFGRPQRIPRGVVVEVQDANGDARESPAITFYPAGHADDARMLVRGSDGTRVTITVDAATGQVSLKEKLGD